MCGFVGFHSEEPLPSALLEKMCGSIQHRGPDDEGFFGVDALGQIHTWKKPGEKRLELKIGLGFRRLAIIDLSPAGAQPMTTTEGKQWIVFNGEIYNYVELKQELKGVAFRSSSDTEVLLQHLRKSGIEALSKLNGIFGFAYYDSETRKLTLARDQFGVKPVYYTRRRNSLFFGSEIRPLIVATGRPKLNRPLVARYLSSNWIPDPDTLFEGIYRLNPGSTLEVTKDHQLRATAYYDFNLKREREKNQPLTDWLGQLDATLDKAVERQMRSDVPIAFFLSGGIDSSLLSVKAKEVAKRSPTTYTIGFKWSGSADDQLDVTTSRALAKQFSFDHREMVLAPSVVNLLPKVVNMLEEPISDPAAICSHLICEAAKGEFKVLVSGQGGDEMFGGYSHFVNAVLTAQTLKLPLPIRSAMNATAHLLPYRVGGKRVQSVHRIKKFLKAASGEWPNALFQLRGSLGPTGLDSILTESLLSDQESPFGRHEEIIAEAADWDPLRQALYLDIKTYLPALNLFYTDKTSMANSVEVRVPFLDMELAALAETLPNEWKVQGRETKRLLKRLAERYLPPTVTHRKKTGFGLPVRDWLLNDLQPMAQELFSESRIQSQGLFQADTLQTWLREHREMKTDHSARIYLMMTLQLWLEQFDVAI